MRPSNSSATCGAVVGLICPNRFVDGAATGEPVAASSANATGWAGTRTATVDRPELTSGTTASVRASTIVSGPGQNRRGQLERTAGQ